MDRVVHFEIPAEEPEKCIQFYTDVFGWSFQRFGENEYWLAITGDEKAPGINGAIMKRRDPGQPVTNSIGVANIDAAMEKVAQSGGTIVVPKTVVPGVGYLCFFKDPGGNIFGIWQQDPSAT